MARNRTVELRLQGQPLSSIGALACLPESFPCLGNERDGRMQAEAGLPVDRW